MRSTRVPDQTSARPFFPSLRPWKSPNATRLRAPSRPSRLRATHATLLLLALNCVSLRGSDWPHLLGPTRDAVYAGPALADKWPAEGPRVVWKLNVGEGYSSPVIADGRLIQCHRLDDQLQVECLDPATGTRHWTFKHAMNFRDGAFFDHGPRPTPAIRTGKVYVHNTDGYVVCLDLKTGAKLWSRHAKSEFKSSGTWHGCAASPLLTDTVLILPVGGTNAGGIVAFGLEDGKTLWSPMKRPPLRRPS
jgi:outer membrane protein assembly factor BamB